MQRLTWDRTAEFVSGDEILRHERGQGQLIFPNSAGHKHGWQAYRLIPRLLAVCDVFFFYLAPLGGLKHMSYSMAQFS